MYKPLRENLCDLLLPKSGTGYCQ